MFDAHGVYELSASMAATPPTSVHIAMLQARSKQLLYGENWTQHGAGAGMIITTATRPRQNDNNNKFGGFDYNDLDDDYDNGLIYDFKSIKIKDINSPHQILDVPKINIILSNYNI